MSTVARADIAPEKEFTKKQQQKKKKQKKTRGGTQQHSESLADHHIFLIYL